MPHGHLDCFPKPPLRLTQNRETMALRTLKTVGFSYFSGPAWIEIHWNSIWLRARDIWLSHYTCGSVTTLHEFGGELGRPLDTFFWALTISWSRLLAHMWNDPKYHKWCSIMQLFRFGCYNINQCNACHSDIVVRWNYSQDGFEKNLEDLHQQ